MGIRQRFHNLAAWVKKALTDPAAELGRSARFVQHQAKLWTHCMRRLRDNNAMAMSAALSFRTIFAMVPTLVLIILMLQALGVQDKAKEYLRDYIDKSGITVIKFQAKPNVYPQTQPTSEPVEVTASAPAAPVEDTISVEGQLNSVIGTVEKKVTLGRLGPIGVALLIWTALTLMTTIERSLNRVFRAPANRPLGRRVLLYWSALTLGPILLIAALAVGEFLIRYANDFFGEYALLKWLIKSLGVLQPAVVGILLFAGAYALIPNTKVKFRAALTGAVVAFPTWLVAIWGFSLYVTNIVGKDPLYGTLGLLPLFLFWLNISWLTFLFGSELAHTSSELAGAGWQLDDEKADPRDALVSPWDMLATAVAVAKPYSHGRGPVSQADVVTRLRIKPASARILLDDLIERKIICCVEQAETDAYVPQRPVEDIRVEDVIDLADPSDEVKALKARPYERDIARAINQARSTARQGLKEATLADLLKTADAEEQAPEAAEE